MAFKQVNDRERENAKRRESESGNSRSINHGKNQSAARLFSFIALSLTRIFRMVTYFISNKITIRIRLSLDKRKRSKYHSLFRKKI